MPHHLCPHLTRLAALLTALGCSGNVETTPPGDVDASSETDGDADTPPDAGGCANSAPAAMVRLPQGYSIDSTEVTRCQYQAWLDTNPSIEDQDPWCAWNTEFAPTGAACGFPPVTDGDLPAGCVDWCDAFAYCKGVGKRLCGKIGGGANAMEDYADETKSQWYNACSSGGKYYYTYGDMYDNGLKCNDADHGLDFTPAGSLSECQSPDSSYAGVFDLSGNVWEWEDSCESATGAQDYCMARGGSLRSGEGYSSCKIEDWSPREKRAVNWGFRCCAD